MADYLVCWEFADAEPKYDRFHAFLETRGGVRFLGNRLLGVAALHSMQRVGELIERLGPEIGSEKDRLVIIEVETARCASLHLPIDLCGKGR